jgi:hypothetical protein
MDLTREQKADLVSIAGQVRKWAYAPYSKYKVGAALLTESVRSMKASTWKTRLPGYQLRRAYGGVYRSGER